MLQPSPLAPEMPLAVLSHLPEAVIVVDQAGAVVFCNAAAETLLPGGIGGLVQAHAAVPYHLLDRHQRPLTTPELPLGRVLAGQHLCNEELLLAVGAPARIRWVAITSCPYSGPGAGTALITLRDISPAQQHNAPPPGLYDTLTGLPNRLLLMDRLSHALARAHSQPHGLMALLLIDVTGVGLTDAPLIGSPGQPLRADLLTEVGCRLKLQARPETTVAHLADNQFVMLLEDIVTSAAAIELADQVHTALSQPMLPQPVPVETRIGIALGPGHYQSADAWLSDADTALAQIKPDLGQPWHLFDNSLWMQQDLKLQTEIGLRHAIERGELRLHYQPIVTLSNQEICGFEALVRWQHPTRGLLLPGEFIQIAETTGLIIPLGWWVLNEACRQMQVWTEQNPSMAAFTVSVNMSSKQFSQPHLVERIRQIVEKTGFSAHRLKIEMTEGVLIDHSDSIITILEQIKALGIKLLVDDFGTGYSSLSYLHRFPFDCLKIDRSFIENADQDFEKLEILQSVVRLAWNLGLDVVAEGIETPRHHAQLKALRCELGQGYLFSRPLAPDAVEAMMAKKIAQVPDSSPAT
ncbi:MAG: phosphodiesterase [Leptolyngbya sp. DLM2.Bin27]|nr:MAG: phosphodiesterase [Leptolyngbya sp. DLM2.Bin27]